MPALNYYGLILGLAAFLIIGLYHPIVAKAEYCWGKRIWWAFFIAGLGLAAMSLFIHNDIGSVIAGVAGFGCFWSTYEIFKQHERVLQGRAKRNPRRIYASSFVLIIPSSLLLTLNYNGIIAGAASFIIIAVSRYICIKAEYYFSKKFWIAFLLIGIVSVAASLFIDKIIVSAIVGINGFTFLWGIGEIIEQEERVKKGWFPRNPKRKY